VTAPPHQPDKRQPRVVRMLNSAAYQLPEVRRLFLASNSRTQDPQFRSAHLAASCQDPRVGNFIGLEAGEPKAMAAIELPFGDIRLCVPTVAVTTNLGSRELGNVTWDAAVAWARSMGVRRLYAANTSGVSDKVYERHFRRHGVKARRVYSWYELNIGDPDESDPGFQATPPIECIFDFSAPPFRPPSVTQPFVPELGQSAVTSRAVEPISEPS
jgi:hypothetical protein